MDPLVAATAYIVFRQEQQINARERARAAERRAQLARALATPFRRALRAARASKGRRPAAARDTLGWTRTTTGRCPARVAVLGDAASR